MKRIHSWGIAVLVAATMAITIPAAMAHHSGVEFDATRVVELTGTVKEFQFKNPHTWIQVMIPDAKGGPSVEWSLEWGAPNSLGRQGVRPTSFPVGAKIVVRINPMKNGSPAGAFIGGKFENGKTIGTWN